MHVSMQTHNMCMDTVSVQIMWHTSSAKVSCLHAYTHVCMHICMSDMAIDANEHVDAQSMLTRLFATTVEG